MTEKNHHIMCIMTSRCSQLLSQLSDSICNPIQERKMYTLTEYIINHNYKQSLESDLISINHKEKLKTTAKEKPLNFKTNLAFFVVPLFIVCGRTRPLRGATSPTLTLNLRRILATRIFLLIFRTPGRSRADICPCG